MDTERILIRIDPHILRSVALLFGLICGLALVLLDPVLRFPGLAVRINLYETLLTGVMLAGYGFLLAFLVTEFWKSNVIWAGVLMTAPLVTGAIYIWNMLTGAFGIASDFLIFFPVTMVFHGLLVALTLIYLHLAKRLPGRRTLAFTGVPIVLLVVAFMVLGRIRWANEDAQKIMSATDTYASGAVSEDYELEYLGMRYRSGLAPTGLTRIHTGDSRLLCQVRLYPDRSEISCETEED